MYIHEQLHFICRRRSMLFYYYSLGKALDRTKQEKKKHLLVTTMQNWMNTHQQLHRGQVRVRWGWGEGIPKMIKLGQGKVELGRGDPKKIIKLINAFYA